MKTSYESAPPYVTKDGSKIRELMHPAEHGNANQSLAEARVPAGAETLLHKHRSSEELYHVTAGWGLMVLGDETFPIVPGDTVHIAPGTAHGLINDGDETLVVLCCCAPAYSHEDTELVEREPSESAGN